MDSVRILKTDISVTSIHEVSSFLITQENVSVAICNVNTLVRCYRNEEYVDWEAGVSAPPRDSSSPSWAEIGDRGHRRTTKPLQNEGAPGCVALLSTQILHPLPVESPAPPAIHPSSSALHPAPQNSLRTVIASMWFIIASSVGIVSVRALRQSKCSQGFEGSLR